MSEKTYTDSDFVTRRVGEENEADTRARMEEENRQREEARVEVGKSLPSRFS
jgi:hypothetical protein